ncbi:MAG: hypothetical protein V4757_06495 [Pseudomonadota bacterium]
MSEDEYWAEVQQLKGTSEFFDEQGDAHGHIDGDLQDAIEAVLVPIVGPWEGSDVWFHNQDFYGNGIRSLSFRAGDFPWSAVIPLQKLLVGEAALFCISVLISDSLEIEGRWVGAMAILKEKIVATSYVVDLLRTHVGVET